MKPSAALPPLAAIAVSLLTLLTACSSSPSKVNDIVTGPGYTPTNIHREADKLPTGLRRVAVLPISADPSDPQARDGSETLPTAILTELARTRLFEIVPVTPEQVFDWTGRPSLASSERLPKGFLERIRSASGADAVLFSRLVSFRAYPPPSIAWNLRLVDLKDGRIWWAAEELFDAGDARILNAARRFQKDFFADSSPDADSRSIASSPRRFAQYSLHALFATLPSR